MALWIPSGTAICGPMGAVGGPAPCIPDTPATGPAPTPGAGCPRSSPLEYPDDWLPTEPTEPAGEGEGVGDSGDGVP